jgi:RHS repeat-associated protein
MSRSCLIPESLRKKVQNHDALTLGGTGLRSHRSHFTGKERDQESGNDRFDARYFGSSMGRFLSPDPSGGHLEDPQTLNKYSYVANNPLSRTDSTGLDFHMLPSCFPNNEICNESTNSKQTYKNDQPSGDLHYPLPGTLRKRNGSSPHLVGRTEHYEDRGHS